MITQLVLAAVMAAAVTTSAVKPVNSTEEAVRVFIQKYYQGDKAYAARFLGEYWYPGNRNEIMIRAYANTASKATLEKVAIVFSDSPGGTLIISVSILGSRPEGSFTGTFVFTVYEGKILSLLPVERMKRNDKTPKILYH